MKGGCLLVGIIPCLGKLVDALQRCAMFTSDHHHEGPRTWIRGRMAPRRLRPAGSFCVDAQTTAGFRPLSIAPRWISRKASAGVVFLPQKGGGDFPVLFQDPEKAATRVGGAR